MSNETAVISIYQHNRGTIGANKTSPFTVKLLGDDYTDLRGIPGLCAMVWERDSEDGAVDVAEEIGQILTQNRVTYTVEWP